MAEKELHYRCRLVVEMYDGEDEPQSDSEPFKSVPLADYWVDADLVTHIDETDTDRGILSEESVEVEDVRVISSDLLKGNAEFLNFVHYSARIRGFLKSEVWDSAERAIEKSEPAEADDVFVEADS